MVVPKLEVPAQTELVLTLSAMLQALSDIILSRAS